MPSVTIDGRTIEVEAGTNLIEASKQVGVQIPHYCYHPRLSVVGQCRMCLVKVEGMRGFQPGCTTQVMKDGMVVSVDDEDVREAQQGMMEFLLINHPLDCPICDQAGECGLQDYSFKHGQAFSRFRYEEKRTYPGKERIPLGPSVVLNMNRCIQCTRCVRFTEEISKTGELGFFQRGSRAEIGVFPGKELDNPLSTCVVDICPVGALTSTKFRFAERVWYLDKKPSVCAGCDIGCNITIEHRRGKIRRYKPRFNPAVNDYWMCDHGRQTFERYQEHDRLTNPRRKLDGEFATSTWKDALHAIGQELIGTAQHGEIAFLASGFATTEEAFLLHKLSRVLGVAPPVAVHEEGPGRFIPTEAGGSRGAERSPNRRGVQLVSSRISEDRPELGFLDFLSSDAAERCSLLLVIDSDPPSRLHTPEVVANLRQAAYLVVMGWADTPLAQVADVALPTFTHPEKEGTYVNAAGRLQKFGAAFPAVPGARSGVDVILDLLSLIDRRFQGLSIDQVFTRMTETVAALSGLSFEKIPAHGVSLADLEAGERGSDPA